MRISAQCCWGLLLALVFVLLPAGAGAAEIQRWDLRDGDGEPWGLVVFPQPDPAYAPGWRLRLTARRPATAPNHREPLRLDDGLGHLWQLDNRSAELVARGESALPLQSAQFDLEALQPRPSSVLPLHLRLVLVDGEAELLLGPDQVAALSSLPPAPSHQP
jgi:hypothetical protein